MIAIESTNGFGWQLCHLIWLKSSQVLRPQTSNLVRTEFRKISIGNKWRGYELLSWSRGYRRARRLIALKNWGLTIRAGGSNWRRTARWQRREIRTARARIHRRARRLIALKNWGLTSRAGGSNWRSRRTLGTSIHRRRFAWTGRGLNKVICEGA